MDTRATSTLMPLSMVDKYGLRTSMIMLENKDKLKINGLKRGHFYNKSASRLPNYLW